MKRSVIKIGVIITLTIMSISLTWIEKGHTQYWIITDIGLGGGVQSEARGINEYGDVVGWVQAVPSYAFLYSQGTLQNLNSFPGGRESSAWAVNDSKAVVGLAQTASYDYHAFSYLNGNMVDLGTLGAFLVGPLT